MGQGAPCARPRVSPHGSNDRAAASAPLSGASSTNPASTAASGARGAGSDDAHDGSPISAAADESAAKAKTKRRTPPSVAASNGASAHVGRLGFALEEIDQVVRGDVLEALHGARGIGPPDLDGVDGARGVEAECEHEIVL
jgi:hypothetical protein